MSELKKRVRWRVELRRSQTTDVTYITHVRLEEHHNHTVPDGEPTPPDHVVVVRESAKAISSLEVRSVFNVEALIAMRIEEALNEIEAVR